MRKCKWNTYGIDSKLTHEQVKMKMIRASYNIGFGIEMLKFARFFFIKSHPSGA